MWDRLLVNMIYTRCTYLLITRHITLFTSDGSFIQESRAHLDISYRHTHTHTQTHIRGFTFIYCIDVPSSSQYFANNHARSHHFVLQVNEPANSHPPCVQRVQVVLLKVVFDHASGSCISRWVFENKRSSSPRREKFHRRQFRLRRDFS